MCFRLIRSRGGGRLFHTPLFFPKNLNNVLTHTRAPYYIKIKGKSLYTTIRELVENGLDAAESIGSLPEVNVTVEELSREEFNRYRGVKGAEGRKDESLFKDR